MATRNKNSSIRKIFLSLCFIYSTKKAYMWRYGASTKNTRTPKVVFVSYTNLFVLSKDGIYIESINICESGHSRGHLYIQISSVYITKYHIK